jgi:carbamoylphosphate synthase small subunit
MTTTHPAVYSLGNDTQGVLLLSDGSSYKGTSFGAQVSVAGETVFQTGILN